MNLIQQLQQSSKWIEFEEWYRTIPELQYPYSIDSIELACGNLYAFKNFPFMFQKGVFEKFIESKGDRLEQEILFDGTIYSIWKDEEYITDGLFENVLIKYFNQ